MTKDEAIANHRKMWNWLAYNPGKEKEDYLQEFDPEVELAGDCYACQYNADQSVDEIDEYYCKHCPLEWPWPGRCDGAGLFTVWYDAMYDRQYDHAAQIAKQIAELPERREKNE